MKAAIILGVVALIVIGVALIAWILTRSEKARQDRRAREWHEAFLDHLHKTAIEARDVEPFASVIADEIRNHLNPSKGIR